MFAEDLTLFLSVDDFADTATLDGEGVDGIFDADYVDALNVENSGPAFTLQTTDAQDSAHGSTLIITSGRGLGTWKVRGIKPDGTGITVLKLEKQ